MYVYEWSMEVGVHSISTPCRASYEMRAAAAKGAERESLLGPSAITAAEEEHEEVVTKQAAFPVAVYLVAVVRLAHCICVLNLNVTHHKRRLPSCAAPRSGNGGGGGDGDVVGGEGMGHTQPRSFGRPARKLVQLHILSHVHCRGHGLQSLGTLSN